MTDQGIKTIPLPQDPKLNIHYERILAYQLGKQYTFPYNSLEGSNKQGLQYLHRLWENNEPEFQNL